jgi:transcriptional regulator with XRE-family HTH domain
MALRQREIGERITALRRSRGNPPQEVVAQQLGVSYRSLQAWEAGDSKPSYRNLTKIAEFFGVTEEFILVGEENASSPRHMSQLDRIETKLEAVLQAITQLGERVAEAELRQAAPDAEALAQSEAAVPAKARPRRARQR